MSTRSMANTATAATKDGMANSFFGRLMPEVRNTIYELALRQPEPIVVRWHDDREDHPEDVVSNSVDKFITALTKTCKQIGKECGTMFYAINKFQFDSSADSMPKTIIVERFLDTIGGENAKAMRFMIVDVGLFRSVLAHFLVYALQEVLRFSELNPHAKFECRASIRPNRLAINGVNYGLLLECSDVAASFQSLAAEKELELGRQAAAMVSPYHWQLLQELKESHGIWARLTKPVGTAKTA
ncbi:hypothetical protein LTR56_014201 [Elasticomyces elasticus]|nr:hypothetical protein LTR56_014201 [Elasticomyces elasticus]KAK3645257.1 hypothetical protein LTR22_014835 [Elasticomyces elasticus]KAK4917366.1 hypothetical protein LTR49_014720 [Elasticomyces elasticus]KAK5755100.1 hypothetical protein LTS12_014783 [Elasticomyces elasticus]